VLYGDMEGTIQGRRFSNGKEKNQNCTPGTEHEQSWKKGAQENAFRPSIKENFSGRNLDQWIVFWLSSLTPNGHLRTLAQKYLMGG
jgi:hypothetical protein